MINVVDYQGIDDLVRVHFIDGQFVDGRISSVDDEEESGLGEMGISLFTPDGGYLGLAESEIVSIEII